jgi:hypothetical protein
MFGSKMKNLLPLVAFALVSCGDNQERAKVEYLAAIKKVQEGYANPDVNRAYAAEIQFIEFVRERQSEGGYLPNPNILIWEYARLGLLAEYCGRKDEAARLYVQAERYARRIYPNEPADKTSAAAFRSYMILMAKEGGKGPWIKFRQAKP